MSNQTRQLLFGIPIFRARLLLLVAITGVVALTWFWISGGQPNLINDAGGFAEERADVSKSKKVISKKSLGMDKQDELGANNRQPLHFRSKPVEPEAVISALEAGEQTVRERVQQFQGMRGISLSKQEREAAFRFLTGKELPEGIKQGSIHWLADELLTVMRLQQPPQDDLAGDLAQAAFQPSTDPVVRDYIMQHLGHYWEQYGAQEEIESTLWRALENSGETTSGTALIALGRGYERDQDLNRLAKVRRRALELARSPQTGLAARVTALSIAGSSGGKEAKELAVALAAKTDTPISLRKVAERLLK